MECIFSFMLSNKNLIFSDLSTNTNLIAGACICKILVDIKSVAWSLSLLPSLQLPLSLVKCEYFSQNVRIASIWCNKIVGDVPQIIQVRIVGRHNGGLCSIPNICYAKNRNKESKCLSLKVFWEWTFFKMGCFYATYGQNHRYVTTKHWKVHLDTLCKISLIQHAQY